MQLPDESGRSTILKHYLKTLKLDPTIDVDILTTELAAATDGVSGADLEYLCQSAARMCVKEAVIDMSDAEKLFITKKHLKMAVEQFCSDAKKS